MISLSVHLRSSPLVSISIHSGHYFFFPFHSSWNKSVLLDIVILHANLGVPKSLMEITLIGSAIAINATMAPFLHQMGLMEEFISLSKLVPSIQIADQDRQIKFTITGGFDDAKKKYIKTVRGVFSFFLRCLWCTVWLGYLTTFSIGMA